MKNAIKNGFGFTIGGALAIAFLAGLKGFCDGISERISKEKSKNSDTKINTPPGFEEWLKKTKPEQYEEFKKHGLI